MPAPPSARARLALAAGCTLFLVACGAGPGPALRGTAPASTAAPVPAEALGTVDGSVTTTRLPVYWVGAVDGRQGLFREFRDPPRDGGSADPIGAAAALMTTAAPEDPDYRTLWEPVDRVGSSTSPDGTITVDLPAEAFRTDLSPDEARLAVQQLAHTVSAAATTAGLLPERTRPRVVVLVDGAPDREVFGAVRLDEPVLPEEGLEAPLWVLDPQQGTRAQGTLTITGRVLDGVGGCRWTVTEKDGDVAVSNGTVETAPGKPGTAAAGTGQFRAEVLLGPGEYVVTVTGRDARGRTVQDDKDVVVTAR